MTEKTGVSYPPLSDEDLARYGGPPELAYLPLVNMANELIAARAAIRAAAQRSAPDEAARGLVREVERLTADLVELDAKRRQAERSRDGLREEMDRVTAAHEKGIEMWREITQSKMTLPLTRTELVSWLLVKLEDEQREHSAHLAHVEHAHAHAMDEQRQQVAVALGYNAGDRSRWDAFISAIKRIVARNDELAMELNTERKVHAANLKLLSESNADHNALLLHLHQIRHAMGLDPGPWDVIAAMAVEKLRSGSALEPDTRDIYLRTRVEALCHRLSDNGVEVEAESWIEHLEAGITKLIEQRDGACARREAEETARIKADAEAVFEAQRADLAIAINLPTTATWNELCRYSGQLRAMLMEVDAALDLAPPLGGSTRAEKVRDLLAMLVRQRGEIQVATKKLCKALGVADSATLPFAVKTAVGLIGETRCYATVGTDAAKAVYTPISWLGETRKLADRERQLKSGLAPLDVCSGCGGPICKHCKGCHLVNYPAVTSCPQQVAICDARAKEIEREIAQERAPQNRTEHVQKIIAAAHVRRLRDSAFIREHDSEWLETATDDDIVDEFLRRVGEADKVESLVAVEKLGGVTMLADGSLPEMVKTAIARAEQAGRAEGKRESTVAVAKLALVREALGATLGADGSDDVVDRARAMQTELGHARHQLELSRADREQAEQDAEASSIMITRAERKQAEAGAQRDAALAAVASIAERLGVERGEHVGQTRDRIEAKLTQRDRIAADRIKALEEHNREMHEGVAMALGHERGGAGLGWKDLIAAIERQGADLREAKGNADSLVAQVSEMSGKLTAYRARLADAASTARGLSDQLDDIETSL